MTDYIKADNKNNNSKHNNRTATCTTRRRRQKAANQTRTKLVRLFEVEEIRLRAN